MVKPLTFKGDKKPAHKKRKREHAAGDEAESSSSRQRLAQQPAADIAGEAAAEDDSSWVSADAPSDVAGPVMLVLCSESGIGATAAPPVALTCDALGGVFATRVENLVDGNVGASAEPHETRQVWVARRVVGADGWTFKGYEGKYLSCAKDGALSASLEAVSPLETFVIEPASDDGSASGVFRLKTSSGAYFCTRPKPSASRKQADTVLPPLPDIRGDGSKESDSGDSTTLVRIRMQARFKPKLQAQKEERAAREKVSRRELEAAAGRRLDDEEVKRLRRARREGDYHEQLLRLKIKGKHDKFG